MQPDTQTTPTADRDDSSHVQLVERDGVAQLFAFAKLPLVSASAPKAWVHVAREGVWRGHHSGQEIALTAEVLAGFVATFGAMKNPPPGTYGHPKGDDFPASAWLLDLEVRGSDLWALCEFTAKAAEAIRAGEYRFCSIEFALEHLGRESGKPAGPIITKLGLTNIPFIDGLTPITLSLVGASAPAVTSRSYTMAMIDPQTMLDSAYKAAGLKPKEATPEQLISKLQAAIAYLKSDAGPAPIAAAAAPMDMTAMVKACNDCLDACKAVTADRTPATIKACVSACKACSEACKGSTMPEAAACAKACDACVASDCAPADCAACITACEACVKAAGAMSLSAKTPVIALADGDPVVPGAGEPLPADAEMAGKCAIADKLMEATGLDAAALLTAVEQNLDALVAVLTAGPSGTGLSAKDGALQLSLVQRSNAALGARVVQLSAEVATLSAGNAEREAKVKSDAIAAEFLRLRDVTGHVIEDMRGDFTAYAMSAGIDAATKIFGRGPAPGTTPLVTGPNAPKVKAPGADADDAPIDDTDPAVKVYRLAYGRGPDADKSIRRVLALSAR